MGSRMMHYVIAKKVQERVDIDDFDSYLLGNIIPDAISSKVAHFYTGSGDDYSFKVDFDAFFQNLTYPLSDYDLGYLCHLVADNFWMTGFYLPWLRILVRNDEELLRQHYQDFETFNWLLMTHYGYANPDIDSLINVVETHPSDQFTQDQVLNLIDDFAKDFLGNNQPRELNIHTMISIEGYIATCVERSVQLINEIQQTPLEK